MLSKLARQWGGWLVLLCLTWSRPAAAQPPTGGGPVSLDHPSCASLWSVDGKRPARQRLVETCNRAVAGVAEARQELARTLIQLSRPGDAGASFLWYFRGVVFADPSGKPDTLSVPAYDEIQERLSRSAGSVDCSQLRPSFAAALPGPGAFRGMRRLDGARQCFKATSATSVAVADPDANYFVTGSAAAGDTVWLLREDESVPVQPPITDTRGAGGRDGVFVVTVPLHRSAVLWVVPDAKGARPLVFRIEPGPTAESSDRFIDSLGARRTFAFTVELDQNERLYINGQEQAGAPAGDGLHPTSVTLNGGIGANAVVVLKDMPVLGDTKDESQTYAILRDTVPLTESGFSYELDLRSAGQADTVGLLPVVPEACSAHGIDDGSVRARIREFLAAHRITVRELGILADAARKYAASVTALTQVSDTSAPTRNGGDNREQFGRGARKFLTQGFGSLLDLRVVCSTVPGSSSPLFGITATRIHLDRVARQDAERLSPHELDATGSLFDTASRVVTDPLDLRDGLVAPLATLWAKPHVRLTDVPAKTTIWDNLPIRVEVPKDDPSNAPLAWLQNDRVDLRVCNAARRANQLEGQFQRVWRSTGRDRRFPTANGSASVQFDQIIAGGYYIVAANHQPLTELKKSPERWWATASFRCVEVREPWLELGMDYYFWTWARGARKIEARPEKAEDRYVLGHFGESNGIALALGYWASRREGVSPASWADAARLHSIRQDGAIPYVYESRAAMIGVAYGWKVRWPYQSVRWLRFFPLEARAYVMPRLEWGNQSEVPAELTDFTQAAGGRASLSVDVTGALSAGVSLEPSRHLSLNLARIALAAPRIAQLVGGSFLDARLQRSVWWDPTVVLVTFGVGGSYEWE